MFSIAAINDTETGGQWEPLAPTKEALEFHLSQTYHEGLLKLQAKDYEKARELLETVLKDPLVSNAHADTHASDGHLLQLRFLALKNLATVFVQQDPVHYENALSCYLQAVEIDASDSVVWNQLGTLSCSMGLLSTSRWAFEQGLLCSPNNWNCMEKLLEVLIAIGDEVACLSVANLILRHWPSHSRALHIKRTIEDEESSPFSPRGIDKLEPKHVRLDFSNKRKATQDKMEDGTSSKRINQTIEICLPVPTWEALADGLLGIILSAHEDLTQLRTGRNSDSLTGKVSKMQPSSLSISEESDASAMHTIGAHKDTSMLLNIKTIINLSPCFEHCKDLRGSCDALLGDNACAKSNILKERDGYIDEEHPQERRSTRLERLRSRKPGKGDLNSSSSKDLAKVVFQFLEPFIVNHPTCKEIESDGDSKQPRSEVLLYSASNEYNLVKKFISTASNNWGAYHLGHLLLEEISHNGVIHQNSFIKFLDLEKLIRKWPQDRSPICSLFLAELYYDIGVCAPTELRHSEFLSDASYHLCKVIELVSIDIESDFSCKMNHANVSQSSKELCDLDKDITLLDNKYASTFPMLENKISVEEGSKCEESLVRNSLLDKKFAFWARFFWVGGCLSLSSGSTGKSLKEFGVCLSLLRNLNKLDGTCCIPLPHCRIVKWLNVDRILHLINLVGIDEALKETAKMMEKGMYKECIKLLDPTLLSTEDMYPDLLPGVFDEKGVTDIELSALDVLLSACEKAEPMEICTYLNAHRRKLRVLAYAAGMIDSTAAEKYSNDNLLLKGADSGDVTAEMLRGQWYRRIDQEIKEVSRCATIVKNAIDQTGTCNISSTVVCSVADLQTLLLTVMCNVARIVLGQKFSPGSSTQTDQIETQCLVDVLIAFCKLQQIDPNVSIKSQVDLIAAVHDLLAEYGLCCAGKDSEGKEGTFLKLAIKHLFSLDVKLKSSFQLGNDKLETKKNDCKVSVNECDLVVDGQFKSCSIDDILTDVSKTSKSMNKNDLEETTKKSYVHDARNNEEAHECQKGLAEPPSIVGGTSTINISDIDAQALEIEREKVEMGIDNALDQSFLCLYGLNLKSGQDQSCEDDLAIHKNTNRGDYQTKEQCADVFQYILPYAKVSSRVGIVKLRRVLREIHKHFPQPSDDVLVDNMIDRFLDSPDLCDDQLYELAEIAQTDQSQVTAMNMLGTYERGDAPKTSSFMRSGPYLEVYSNLYYLIAQAEETSATDKFAGFILNKEGAEFVEQNANLFKYDLLYNPLHFKSWQKLANIYDEEVDLLLNDGSKHINNLDWGKNASLLQRVEKGRRRSRRCLLMSLALARTPLQQSQIHELLGLVYYDGIQNVVPFYDQRSVRHTKDEAWLKFCQSSLKHFEKAFALSPDWIHAFYLGKLSEKMGYSSAKAFSYYNKAILLNPSAVDPYYRMHASRLKMLYSGKWNAGSLKICALYCFSASKKQAVCDMLNWTDNDLQQSSVDIKDDDSANDSFKGNTPPESHQLDEVWHLLYDDCLSALAICTEGELKHYHKARYMLALGYYRRNEKGDLELAKDELSFCFRSTRSPFTINMWEIDGMVKKGKRKTQSLSGNRRVLEVSLPESSRKFITCIRKYILLYLELLEKSKDLCTLERAYVYLRTDRRFSVCLGDIVPVALGRYIKALTLSISCIETTSSADASIENLLEKMFHILMDHVNLWADISNLPEVKCSELSESILYEFLHQYIYLLESYAKLDPLEAINEKLRKRFKSPKLASVNSAKMCRHASLAWCRSILVNLAHITPVVHTRNGNLSTSADNDSENGFLLFVDVQPNELCNFPLESVYYPKDLEMKWCQPLLNLRKVCIQKASEQNSEMAHMLLRSAYSFYKESSCGTFPSGINLYTMLLSPHFVVEEPFQPGKNGIEILDLSIPRKLLLWAYTLIHGQYSNILVVVKHCEEIVKSKLKRGTASTTSPQSVASPLAHMGCGKDRNTPEDRGIKENSADPHSITNETPKFVVAASQLKSYGTESEITQADHNTTTDKSEL